MYPVEFLNQLHSRGLPPHELTLKVGLPIILLRNLCPKRGLANGTRLIITALHDRSIEAEVITGPAKGNVVFIPRIPLTPTETELNIEFTRLQFPIRIAYAMTINKAQGQTLERVGVLLDKPCFSHGQLYVALSRVGDPEMIRVMITHEQRPGCPTPHTDNVVYKSVFINPQPAVAPPP
jgi:ATP-dependent DNA helicase PIF1